MTDNNPSSSRPVEGQIALVAELRATIHRMASEYEELQRSFDELAAEIEHDNERMAEMSTRLEAIRTVAG